MKKTTLSLLFSVLFGMIGLAQGHETFENLLMSGNSYQNGTFLGQDGSIWKYTQARGDSQSNVNTRNQAIMLGKDRTPNSSLESGIIENGMRTLQFSYRRPFSTDVNLKVFVNDSLVATVITNAEEEVMNSGIIDVNIDGDVILRFENPPRAGQVNIDDIIWTAMAASPTLSITSPTEGEEIPPLETPNIVFHTTNFEVSSSASIADGDGYLQYSINSEDFIDYFSTQPIVLDELEAGTHHFTLRLVDNNGIPLQPGVEKTVNFTSIAVTNLPSIQELRESPLNHYYSLSEEVVLSFQQDYRGQKYIQDANAGILIEDLQGIITTEYEHYDGITKIGGELREQDGLKLFIPIIDPGSASSNDNTIEISVLDMEDFIANPSYYESQIIAFKNVHFVDADGVLTFATGQNYRLSDGQNNIIVRTNFYDADYIGNIVPQGTQTVISGIAAHYNGNPQLLMRDTADLEGTTLSTESFSKTSYHLYPNPATDRIYVDVTKQTQVEIYSILGQKLIDKQIFNASTPILLNDLKSGVYMVKITQDGNITSKKLVVK